MTDVTRRELLAKIGAGLAALPLSKGLGATGLGPQRGLHFATLTQVAGMVRARDVSSVELTELLLDRIDRVDRRLHAYVTVTPEEALASARRADEQIGIGNYFGPLHGIPIAVKDLFFTRGVRTTGGLGVRKDFVPAFDATAVARLQSAGAVLVGKLGLTEGAWVGYHPDFEVPVNPWGDSLWSGVSSSGSGVATAAGLCFACLGTDTGGSIRIPATANGGVGLKPTYGRVSRHGVIPLSQSLDHVGPMARGVEDVAVMLEAIAGADGNDRTSLDAPVPNMRDALQRGVRDLRIGFDPTLATTGVDTELADALHDTVGTLEGLGARIVEVAAPGMSPEERASWGTVCSVEALAVHAEDYATRPDGFGTALRQLLAAGAGVASEQYEAALDHVRGFRGRYRAMLAEVDAFVGPSAGTPVAIDRAAQYGTIAEAMPFEQGTLRTTFTFPSNFAGTPSLSLPCGATRDGLPLTMQIEGKPLSEATLCQIGHAYEQATDWNSRHPDV